MESLHFQLLDAHRGYEPECDLPAASSFCARGRAQSIKFMAREQVRNFDPKLWQSFIDSSDWRFWW